MKISKVVLGLASVLALAACAPRVPDNGQTSNPDSETTQSTETTKVEEFLSNIFGTNAKYGAKVEVKNDAYPNIEAYYVAKDNAGKLIGHVFIAKGDNTYGSIKMSVGIKADESIGKVFLIENTQSFGPKVQEEYVDKYNKGEREFDDVKCGATYGATLINEMGKQAQSFVKAEINKQITDFAPYCKEVFGSDKVSYIRKNNVIDTENKNLKEFWTAHDDANNKTLGRVYHAEINKNNFMIGINKGGEYGEANPKLPQTLKKVVWVNSTTEGEGAKANEFITKLNAGTANLEDDATDNQLIKDIKAVAKQALAHGLKNKITNPVSINHLLAKTFGAEVSYCEQTMVDDVKNPNILEYWNVKDANRKYIGRVYHMEAPGEHGALHVAVGVKPNNVAGGEFYKVATDARTPDPTSNAGLQAYIAGLNDGSIDINNKDDASCGATGTANGIRSLALIAVKHYGANIIADMYLENIYGNTVTYMEHTVVGQDSVREYWNVMDPVENQYIGRVYHVAVTGKHATIHALVGVTTTGDFVKMYLVNRAPGEYGDKLQKYVNDLNDGEVTLEDDIHNGATASSTAVRDIAKAALAHFKTSPVLPLLADTTYVQSLFDNTITLHDHRKVSEAGFENVVEYWTAKNAEGKAVAGAYHCAFAGKHAIMNITVSIYTETVNHKTTPKLGKINLLNKAPNKYGEILQEYVDKLNSKEIDINDDIHNGASSSSGAVKEMVLQAMNHVVANHLDDGMSMARALTKTFGADANYGEAKALHSVAHDNLLEYWDVKNGETNLGRVYHGAFAGSHGVLHVLIGVNADGTLKIIYWANNPANAPANAPIPEHVKKYGRLAQAWIDKINNGEIKLTDDVHSGASATTGGIISLAEQALDHFALDALPVE